MAFRSLKGDLGSQPCGDSTNRLQRSMAVIFSKYDKDFPESDIINLEDLSIIDDRGFLNRLPKEQAMWNSNLLAESNPSGLHGGPDLDVPSKDLSTTALDMFLEEVISESQHGNITEVDESFQNEDSEDFSDDIASVASGVVTKECDDVNLVEEDDKESSSDDERSDGVADKPLLFFEESLDKMKRVEAWLKGRRKRKAISKEDSNLLNKAYQSKVSTNCGGDADAAVAQEWASRGVFTKKNEQWEGIIRKPNSGKRTPSRKHLIQCDSDKLVTNVAALESPVNRGETCTSSEHIQSPASRILIESWKLSVLKLCNDDAMASSNNQCLSRKVCAVSPRSSSSLAQPYCNTDAYSDARSRSSQVSSSSDTQYTDDDDEQERSLKMNDTKGTRAYSFSQQYLQDFNKNFCKRKIALGRIDSPESNGVSVSTEAVNVISRGHKVTDRQLQNRVNKMYLHCKKRSVSPQNTFTLSGSDGKYNSSMNSEMNMEKQQSEPVNSRSGKVQNEVTYETDISDTRCKTLSPQSDEVGVKGGCVLSGSHGLQTTASYDYTVTPLLENSLEEGEDLPSSFVPCHSSTIINITPLEASHECTLEAENQIGSKVKGKMNKRKVQSKHCCVKDLPSEVVRNKGDTTGRVIENTSLALQRETYHCTTNPLSNTVERGDSTDRHFANEEDFLNPIQSPKGINKACKVPSGKTCGGPSKCKKVFCLDCCHSPCV
ncbi:hypothetical protein HOLleu_02641 [Holothuria leucospilota]|uniref:Uncharacterized protein n=1 Tax=Holothuria leucospilota TaxID=206669 RepID=A0A9Q1HLI6_HOLLE|nr:hypothetical protein HOLleu_02641 [Holothuria leucospilota]